MNIESVCTRDVATVDRDAPLRAAAQVMLDRHVGALVVTAAGGTRVAGVITDRDIAVEALARELDAGRASVGDLASGRAVAIPASASIGDAIATMREEGLRRLLVTDGRGRLAGIVTLDDLVDALAGQLDDLAEALRGGPRREAAAHEAPTAASLDALQLPPEALAARWRQIAEP